MHKNTLIMRTSLMVLFILFTTLSTFGQNNRTDKFLNEFKQQKIDSLQTNMLLTWMDLEQSESGIYDSGTFCSKQIIAIGQKEKNTDIEAIGQTLLGYYFVTTENHPKALEHFQKGLQLGEQLNNPRVMLRLYYFMSIHDYANRIKYLQKVMVLAKQTKEINWQILVALETGREYFFKKQYNLALPNLLQAYEMNQQLIRMGKKGFEMEVDIITYLGFTYNGLHNPTLALKYFRHGLQTASKKKSDRELMGAYCGLAAYFKENHNADSTFYYSSKFYKLAEKSPQIWDDFEASEMLYHIYKEKGDSANALKYHEIFTTAKDSMNSIDKTKKVQNLLLQEKERQKELAEKREQEKEQAKNNLQYMAITLGLVCFIILFLLLSHTVIVNQKLISFLGTVALLIIFEFLNLLLHPYLGDLTHHSPILMLLTMVCIAAILIPLHHKIEHWAIHKLVEKNKIIRLAAAKKTIEELETEPTNE